MRVQFREKVRPDFTSPSLTTMPTRWPLRSRQRKKPSVTVRAISFRTSSIARGAWKRGHAARLGIVARPAFRQRRLYDVRTIDGGQRGGIGLAAGGQPVCGLEQADFLLRILAESVRSVLNALKVAQIKQPGLQGFHLLALVIKAKGFCLAGYPRPQQKPFEDQAGQPP